MLRGGNSGQVWPELDGGVRLAVYLEMGARVCRWFMMAALLCPSYSFSYVFGLVAEYFFVG